MYIPILSLRIYFRFPVCHRLPRSRRTWAACPDKTWILPILGNKSSLERNCVQWAAGNPRVGCLLLRLMTHYDSLLTWTDWKRSKKSSTDFVPDQNEDTAQRPAANTQWQICCHHMVSCPSQPFQFNGDSRIPLDWPMNFRRCHQLSWKYILQPGNNAQKEPQGNPTIQYYVWRLHVSFGHAACWTKIQISQKSCHAFAILCGTTARDMPTEVLSQTSGKNMVQQIAFPSRLSEKLDFFRIVQVDIGEGANLTCPNLNFSSKSQPYDHITNLHDPCAATLRVRSTW